ncbi:MAG TPA: flavodoxin domain-containing protein [Candidatus Limnocylindrales bacterium]|nr:flavodoxin domain-containing protein [Candidatus Limnocylindrales bacterium]
MRVLVVWESKHGSTADMALAIGEVLRARGLNVDMCEVASAPDDVKFDAYVIGSAVYAGHWMKRIKQYVHDNREVLLSHRVWLFSSGPIGRPPRPQEPPVDLTQLMADTGPRDHMIFAGKLDRTKLSFAERAIVAALRAPEGDFRDWDEIRGWAGQIADELTKDRLLSQRG